MSFSFTASSRSSSRSMRMASVYSFCRSKAWAQPPSAKQKTWTRGAKEEKRMAFKFMQRRCAEFMLNEMNRMKRWTAEDRDSEGVPQSFYPSTPPSPAGQRSLWQNPPAWYAAGGCPKQQEKESRFEMERGREREGERVECMLKYRVWTKRKWRNSL